MDLLIIGLGNPGRQYEETNHNVGFDFINGLSQKLSIRLKKALFLQAEVGRAVFNGNKIILVKPQTFMNRSGDIFPKILKYTGLGVESLLVVCDQLDLPPGVARLKKSGSAGGQKGLNSIIQKLNTNQFMRLFIGIGRPAHEKMEVVHHVLSKPQQGERAAIEQAIEFSASQILQIKEKSLERVIQEINSTRFSASKID